MMSAACLACTRRVPPETLSLAYGLVFDAVRWQIVVLWTRALAAVSVPAPTRAKITSNKPSRLICVPPRSVSSGTTENEPQRIREARYSIVIVFGSTLSGGSFGSSLRSVSTRIRATARFLTQLRSAGTTYHGAQSVDVFVITSS